MENQNNNINPNAGGEKPVEDSLTPKPTPVGQEPQTTPVQPQVIRPDASPSPAPNVIVPAPVAPVAPTIPPTGTITPQPSLTTAPILPGAPSNDPEPISGSGVVVGSMPNETGTMNQPANNTANKGMRSIKRLKLALILLFVVLIIGGGSVAAYESIIVPNKPINILKAAFVNSFQQQHVGFTSTVNASPATGTGVAYKAAISGSEDAANKAFDVQVNLTVTGVTFPAEIRFVNGNLYFKIGNINDLSSLLGTLAPSDSTLFHSLASKLSDQWFIVDSSLINSTQLRCFTNSSWTFSQSDINQLEKDYNNHQFFSVDSASGATLNGSSVEKYNLTIDDNKGAAFISSLDNLSTFKSIMSCEGSKTTAAASISSGIANDEKTPITVWVNKGTKQIVQLSAQTTAQDAKQTNLQGNLVIDFTYNPVTISVPQNAQSVTQLLTILESYYLGSSGTTTL